MYNRHTIFLVFFLRMARMARKMCVFLLGLHRYQGEMRTAIQVSLRLPSV